jgi:AAHS family 3-hydroxyphenylpropionic acid transporter
MLIRDSVSRTVLLCFLGTLCEGIDLQAAGVAAAGIRLQFHPDSQLLSYFFSASTFGLFIGAIVGGRLADRYGRKPVLTAAITLFGLFSILNPLAWDMDSMIGARFLTGVGLGGALPNLLSIGSESAAAHRRSASVTLIYAGMPLGGVLASLVSLVTSVAHWRWIFIVGGIVPLAVAPLIGIWLQESQAFSRLKAAGMESSIGGSRVLAFLREGGVGRTLLLWVSFFLALLTLYLLLNWLPTLLSTSGFDRPAVALCMAGFNLGGCLGTVYIASHLETRLRPLVVLGTFGGMPIVLALLAATLHHAPVVAAMVFALGAVVVAAQGVLYAFAPLCYPTRSRGTGVGVAVAMGRIGSIAGPLLGGVLVGAGRSSAQVLTGILPIVLVGGLCAVVLAWRAPSAQPD